MDFIFKFHISLNMQKQQQNISKHKISIKLIKKLLVLKIKL